MTSPLLEADGIAFHRGDVAVLDGIALTLRPGEAVALVGPNAAGKSTLLRVLAGVLPASRGEVRVGGRELRTWPRDALARQLALVAPDQEGLGALTVRDRVRLGRYPHRGPLKPWTDEDEAKVDGALARTGIARLAERRLQTLSAGERQLAGLARAFAQEPRVLLLDEPAAHLDAGHALELFGLLDEARDRGIAVLAVIHDLPRAGAWAQRAVLLSDGRVADEGPPRSVLLGSACAKAFGIRVRVVETTEGDFFRLDRGPQSPIP